MLVIGERINASTTSVAEAIARRDVEFLQNLAKIQVMAGADFIDVNVGASYGSGQNGTATMEWLVDVVQEATDTPLAIDSDFPDIIEAALCKYRGEKMIINSVTAEPVKLELVGRLAAERQSWLIALAMGENGIPDSVEERLSACDLIITYLSRLGIPNERLLFDPLVLPIAVDSNQGLITLKTIEEIKSRYPGAKTVMGLSNISYSLPNRKLVNRAFLLMAAYAGLDAVILDPLDTKTTSLIKAADMLTGKDPLCRSYLRTHRKGTIVD
ncbi:dihydropteroate synthase [Chloroflexota bacterium]